MLVNLRLITEIVREEESTPLFFSCLVYAKTVCLRTLMALNAVHCRRQRHSIVGELSTRNLDSRVFGGRASPRVGFRVESGNVYALELGKRLASSVADVKVLRIRSAIRPIQSMVVGTSTSLPFKTVPIIANVELLR
jgi:hypothetical protein